MNPIVFRAFAVVLVLGLVSSTVIADPAIVIKNLTECNLPGADEDGNFIVEGGVGIATTIVENDNKVLLKCKGKGVTNLSGRAQSFSGFLCFLLQPSVPAIVVSYDSHATVSAKGVGSLTCTFDKP